MSTRRSLFLSYGAQAVSFFVTFASTLVVARLVSPRDFGIYAMAGAITTVINVFMQFGLAKYIMREKILSAELLRSLFTINALMTLVYSGGIALSSLLAGQVFDSIEVQQFLLVFAVWPLIAMMEFVPSAICARDMRFGAISCLIVIKALVLSSSTILLAVAGFTYMSFAYAHVITGLVTAIGFNIVVWRPDVWKPRLKGGRAIFKFGFQMIGVGGLGQLNVRAGEMTLGSLLGLANLGLYSRASGLPANLYGNVIGVGTNVVFSRMAAELRDAGSFHDTYFRFMRLLLGLMWPMMIGIAVLAQPIIAILYGEKWQAAAWPMSLVTIAVAITVAIGMTAEIFVLRHQSSRQLRIEAVRAAFGYAAFAAGAMISLTLAAAAKVAEAILAFALYRKPMIELVGGPSGALRRVYLEALLLTAVAVLPSLLLMIWSGWSPDTPLPFIIAAIGTGVLAWAILLVRLGHPIFLESRRLLIRSV